MRVNPIQKRLFINKNVPIAFHGKSLTFSDGKKKFDLEGDLLVMMTNYISRALSIEESKGKKLRLDLLDEMRFDRKNTGNKSSGDKNLFTKINSAAIRACSLKISKPKGGSTRLLYFNPKEFCDDRLNLLIQEKQTGNVSNKLDEEVIAIADELLEFICLCVKEDIYLLTKCLH